MSSALFLLCDSASLRLSGLTFGNKFNKSLDQAPKGLIVTEEKVCYEGYILH